MLDEKRREKESERGRARAREAGRKMGVGGFCRHGALRPTPVPSALTYFQSGFLFRSNTGPCKKILFDFFFVGYFLVL